MKQIDQLTSLRGLAAWWVVLFHFRDALGLSQTSQAYQFMAAGYLAVDFFFILSGFIIYLNYRHSLHRISSESLKSFYVRRLARIYPLHLLMLLMYLVNPLAIVLFSQSGTPGDLYEPSYYLASLFLVQNWGLFDGLKWNVPAWSISTEFAAYLVFPIIALMLRYIVHSLLLHGVLLVGLLIALPWIFSTAGVVSLGDQIPRLGIVRCLIEFTAGAVLGSTYAHHHSRVLRQRWVIVVGGGLLCVLLISGVFRDYFLAPALFSAVVIGLSLGTPVIVAMLRYKIFVYIGEISYSTYLVHYFVRDWVKFLSDKIGAIEFVLYLLLVLASSVVLYRTVEMPGRRWVQRKFLAVEQSKFSQKAK